MNDMARGLAPIALVPFDQMERMAAAIAKSGLFGMKTPDQALALMLTAQAEGQHPATITQDYDIIQGRAARKTHSVLARYQQAGGSIEWHVLTDKVVEATFTPPRGTGSPLRMQWTIEMARAAKLDGKDNWKGYPRAMLRSRLIAEGVRATYPAAIGGMLIDAEAQDLPPPTEKDVTAQGSHTIEKPRAPEKGAYEQTSFDENLPKWRKLIAAGKKTAADIIATVEAKYTLTEEQRSAIRGDSDPAPDDLVKSLRDKAHAAGIADEEIAKHLGVENLDGLTIGHIERALVFLADPMGGQP